MMKALLALVVLSGSVPTAAGESWVSPRELQDWLSYYYLTPDETRTKDYLTAMEQRGVLADKASRAPISAFLAQVFRDQADIARDWCEAPERPVDSAQTLSYALWLAGLSESARKLADHGGLSIDQRAHLELPPPDLRRMTLRDPAELDVIWAAFAGSGDLFYVRRLIRLLDKAEATGKSDSELAQATRETLKRNMRQHARVREYIRSVIDKLPTSKRGSLETLWLNSLENFQPFETRKLNFSAQLGLHTDPYFERRWQLMLDSELPRLPTRLEIKPHETIWLELLTSGMYLDTEQNGSVSFSLEVIDPTGEPILRIAPMNWLAGKLPTPFQVYRLPSGIRLAPQPRWNPGVHTILAKVQDRMGGAELTLNGEFRVVDPSTIHDKQ